MWTFRRLLNFFYFLLFCGLLWYAVGAAWWEPYRYLRGHVESAASVQVTITGAQRKALRFCETEGWRYTYLYIVEGQRYTGYANRGCGTPVLAVGDKLPAIYDQRKPGISYVEGDIDWQLFTWLALATCGLMLGVFLMLRRPLGANNRPVQPEPGLSQE